MNWLYREDEWESVSDKKTETGSVNIRTGFY